MTKMIRKKVYEPALTFPVGIHQRGSLAENVGAAQVETGGFVQFERLISCLSARFVNIAADEVDAEIERALKLVLDFFGGDRCGLLGVSQGKKFAWVTHACYAEGIEQVPGDINIAALFPWSFEILVTQGKHVSVPKMEDLPLEAEKDRLSWTSMGVRSSLTIPLFIEGEVASLIVINAICEERAWPEEYVPRLRLLGDLFVNALSRKRVNQALRESEERLSLAIGAAETGLWSLDVTTSCLWVTDRTRQIFGFAPDEEISMERVMRTIHPEDRDMVRQVIERAIRSREMTRVDYRIVLPDGSVKWIASRGRTIGDASGTPARLMGVSFDITERKQMEEQLHARLREIEDLKQRLERENVLLRSEASLLYEHGEIVGASRSLKRVLSQVEQVAGMDSTVLIMGETGTGKELLAREIHNLSSRRDRPLVTVNCASLPPTLIESELFGREKGAYTGALTRMAGRFEVADGSTFFLDEIAELPLKLQAKLLRVIEEGVFERLGSTKTIRVNVRVIAATNRDLAKDMQQGAFRQDLYYRLNVFPIMVPPLRERQEDIPLLVWAFVRQFEKKMGKQIDSIPRRGMEALQRYSWPGNVRELRNVIEHAMIVSRDKTLDVRVPTVPAPEQTGVADLELESAERRHILTALQRSGWRITGPGGAAKALGLKRTTLQSRMKKLGIERPSNGSA